ncbi:hypothetical protein LHK_02713 [Laribacter hongkongensis HLHK9]|uniref:Uncharacterized protein n=1 Tax=Laribacter hongkongensis (strain HLHK9) TaxID=557598 RepID=C1DCS5_LARHH|nr:hypothetical protein LHK_02713 [Laribacter hongkongensis HLHK9]
MRMVWGLRCNEQGSRVWPARAGRLSGAYWLGGRIGVNGRLPVYTDATIQTVLTLKVLFRLAFWLT